MREDAQSSVTQFTDGLGRFALALVSWLLRHWLVLVGLGVALYTALPVAAPFLMQAGQERAGRLIYLLFLPLCHQMPERSFFMFGAQSTYTLEELAAHLGGQIPLRYIGDAVLGYKIAVCQRDVAIYGAMLVAIVLYGVVRKRVPVLPRWALLLCAAPMAVDGGGQLVGLWSSSPWSRVVTGALFGLTVIWWGAPRLARVLAGADLTGRSD